MLACGMNTIKISQRAITRAIGNVGCAISLGLGAYVPSTHAAASPVSISRWKDAYDTLTNLDKNWEKTVKGEGDNVRRQLGTVYAAPKCLSPLCSFNLYVPKFISENANAIDNIDEILEPSAELLEALNQADFLAYSQAFSDYGNGGGGTDYIKQSREQVQRSSLKLKEIIDILEKSEGVK